MTSETTAQDPRPKTQDPGLDEAALPVVVQEFIRAADRVTAWLIKPNVPIVPAAELRKITAAMAAAASRINLAAETQSIRNWLRNTLEGRGVYLVPIRSEEPCPVCQRGPGTTEQGPGAWGQGPGEQNTEPDTILKVHCPHCASVSSWCTSAGRARFRPARGAIICWTAAASAAAAAAAWSTPTRAASAPAAARPVITAGGAGRPRRQPRRRGQEPNGLAGEAIFNGRTELWVSCFHGRSTSGS